MFKCCCTIEMKTKFVYGVQWDEWEHRYRYSRSNISELTLSSNAGDEHRTNTGEWDIKPSRLTADFPGPKGSSRIVDSMVKCGPDTAQAHGTTDSTNLNALGTPLRLPIVNRCKSPSGGTIKMHVDKTLDSDLLAPRRPTREAGKIYGGIVWVCVCGRVVDGELDSHLFSRDDIHIDFNGARCLAETRIVKKLRVSRDPFEIEFK